MKLPIISGKSILGFLLKQGFTVKRQRGSHIILFKQTEKTLYVTVPLHANKPVTPGTLLSIIRQSGMTKEEFLSKLTE